VLEDVAPLLRCPHCGGDLTLEATVMRCPDGHSFDVARQGYVNLLPGDAETGTADAAAMVQARERFLSGGHYAPVVDAVAAAGARALTGAGGCAVDLGAGPGNYLAATLDRLPERVGLALDNSSHALRRAARAHPRIGAVGCDAWMTLPVRDDVAAVVLSVFSPRNPAEIERVLERRGRLVVATPTERHLRQLVERLELVTVDDRKRERLDAKLRRRFEPLDESDAVEYELALQPPDLADLIAMGPNARHLDRIAIEAAVQALAQPFVVTVSVTVASYGLRGRPRP
jgi:23S rRNA (guanine745-N1)-methyltransferase